jgi:hypothetical protein
MIWEQKSLVIVAVIEKAKPFQVPIPQYWPEEEGRTLKFWNLKIKTTKIENFGSFILSRLKVTNLKVK